MTESEFVSEREYFSLRQDHHSETAWLDDDTSHELTIEFPGELGISVVYTKLVISCSWLGSTYELDSN